MSAVTHRNGAGSVPEMVLAQARRQPDAPAAEYLGERTTYRQLAGRAAGIAAELTRSGVRPGAVVAVHTERGPGVLAAQLGVWLMGGVCLTLPSDLPRGRLETILTDAAPEAVVGGPRGGPEAVAPGVPRVIDPAECAPAEPGALVPAGGGAYLIYTSGSTGVPKGVLVGHESFALLARWHGGTYGVTPADRASSIAALSFDAFMWETWPYLCHGASVHFAPAELKLAPWELGDWYREQGIGLSFLPTPLAEAYLRHGTHFGQLRCLLTGGDRLRLWDGHPLRRFVNHYGPTETTVVATSHEVAPTSTGAVPIGRAIGPSRTMVVDGERETAPGAAGELLVGGACLALGYWGNPAATERSFVRLTGSGDRWYRTGDLVRRNDEGELEFLGRIDRQIKVRGVRVEPGEIEAVLGRCPGVSDVVVDWDQDAARLTAYVVGGADGGDAHAASALTGFARRQLPAEMVPQHYVFLDRIPMTAHGKVDRTALVRTP
ncbi:amino acid adenylation domain-containing protein [Streptomyces tricolor]|uniref:Amino acid adenylation domain-containing protein n=1 Tax=Streptomyces tricolor TaxID=68277 RepID=A0ABS9JMR6_9ACTN|nr:amino acid adenylation domain-containing protein [Streptomyces tricolor]MCG0066859.1 amino acid adenylation domain-containing protein [Streptomyces tricolor]